MSGNQKMTEIVLPDGRFASVRKMTVGDLASCYIANMFEFQAALAARLTLLDNKPVALSEVMAGDYETWRPVFKLILDQLERSHQLQGGVA